MNTKFVAIGHVDTGKSTLCGHLLYLTGYIDEHELIKIRQTAEKNKMSRWSWAYILDMYKEERAKGKTHEMNQIDFNHKGNRFTLVDTPGHLDFVREMIKGTHDVNIAVLIASAIPTEFESSFERGMLKEHLMLAGSRRIQHLIVAINKMDAVDWDEKQYNKVVDKVNRHIKHLKAWKESNVKYLPISAWEGDGLIKPSEKATWYKGSGLLDLIDKIGIIKPTHKYTNDTVTSKELLVSMRVFNSPIPITAGYSGVLHYNDCETEYTIKTIISDKKILTDGDKAKAILTLAQAGMFTPKQVLIIRKDKNTIGYCLVKGRKPI